MILILNEDFFLSKLLKKDLNIF